MSDQEKPKPWATGNDKTVSGSTLGGPQNSVVTGQQGAVARPVGVTVICVINFAVAALLVVLIVMSLFGGPGDKSIAIAAILPAIISLGLGFALWQMLPWARNTALVLYGVYALSAIFNAFKPSVSAVDILSIIVPGAIVVYLLQPKVQAAFERNIKL